MSRDPPLQDPLYAKPPLYVTNTFEQIIIICFVSRRINGGLFYPSLSFLALTVKACKCQKNCSQACLLYHWESLSKTNTTFYVGFARNFLNPSVWKLNTPIFKFNAWFTKIACYQIVLLSQENKGQKQFWLFHLSVCSLWTFGFHWSYMLGSFHIKIL